MAFAFSIALFGNSTAFSQSEGCGRNFIDTSTPENFRQSLEWSLWTFRSDAWNGYIDFQGDGRYWTHWGYGRWSVGQDGTVHLINDYDSYQHDFRFTSDGRHYQGTRSDRVVVTGDLLCGMYPGQIPSSPELERPKEIISGYYRELLGRESDPAGLQYWLKQYQNGVSLEEIKRGFYDSLEYRAKHPEQKPLPPAKDFLPNYYMGPE